MSARDAESGSSTYKGGGGSAGGLGNGGIGGGMGGGGMGGGAGRNGGIGSNTGMSTGNTWRGTSAYGRPGGMAMGYGMSPMAARQAAMVAQQGIMARLQQGMPRPAAMPGVMPPAVPPPVAMPPAVPAYNPLSSILTRPPTMQDMPPVPPANFGTLAPGQPKYQDRVPSGVGDGGWPGQAGGPHWSSNGTYSGYDGPNFGAGVGGRGGGGGGGGGW